MKRWRARGFLAAVWVSAALTGCGGGGSGGSSSAHLVPIRVSPASQSATTIERTPATLTYTLDFDASLAQKSFYIGIQDSGDSIDANPTLDYQSATVARITFSSKGGLSIGVHSGTLEFYACNDSTCKTFMSNTPATAKYQINVQAAPPAFEINPAQLTVTAEEGDAVSIPIQITQQPNAGGQIFVVSDPAGAFQSDTTITSIVGQTYTINLTLSPNVAVGSHADTLTLLACLSTPCTRDNTVTGGAVAVPYSVTITPFVIPQPVPTASGLPEWESFQGNSGHTGHVPVTLDPTHFHSRWTWMAPAGAGTLSPATTGSGRLALSASNHTGDGMLFVLNEADGSLAWSHDFGPLFGVDDPGIYSDRVFVASTDEAQHTYMWAFDLKGGSMLFQTAFFAQWEHYLAPAFHAGYLYTDGGTYGGMYAFKQTTGVPHWFASLEQDDGWTPAVDDRFAYSFTAGRFHAVDLSTGKDFFVVGDPSYNWGGYEMNIAPVVSGEGHVLVVDGIFQAAHANHLISYDITAQNQAWLVDGSFIANPVVAHDVIYTLNADGNQLEARDLASGSLLWSWTPTGSQETLPIGNLVLTDNLLFLCSNTATYAIDLTTHQPVWSTAQVGALAMSSGPVLYVVSAQGSVNAYDLQ